MNLQDSDLTDGLSNVTRRDVLRFSSTSVVATAAGCLDGRVPNSGQPTTTESYPRTALQITNRVCDETTENSGSLSISGDRSVVATGTVLGDSTCDDLVVGTFSNQEDTEFLVELTVRSGTNGECNECKTGIEYEATVTFPDELPPTVHLVYDTRHGSMALDALENP